MGKYGRKPCGAAAAVSAVLTSNELSMQAQRSRPDLTSSTVYLITDLNVSEPTEQVTGQT